MDVPFDVLHDEVREPVVRRPAIQQPGDVGVIEAGENLSLGAEATTDLVGVQAELDDLDGDAALELVVVAYGQVDGAHPAASELADDRDKVRRGARAARRAGGWSRSAGATITVDRSPLLSACRSFKSDSTSDRRLASPAHESAR